MARDSAPSASIPALTDEVRALVRLAGAIAGSDAGTMRQAVEAAAAVVRPVWVEEVILQSYLFAGFPRTLNAMREWRRLPGHETAAIAVSEPWSAVSEWTRRGEITCRAVYGAHYDPLRQNIRALHPALDAWMITEGYGKVLSRGALDLLLRELCIVAACAVSGQDRQLRSHLLGARNVGATVAQIDGTLAAVEELMSDANVGLTRELWSRMRGTSAGTPTASPE